MAARPGIKRAEFLVSLGVLALGAGAAAIALALPEGGGYAGIGPNVVPKLVAAGLVLAGSGLLYEACTGGWRAAVPDDPAERGDHAFVPSAFCWVAIGLVAQMLLLPRAGFPLAAAVLFVGVARGFGSVRPLRDALAGLAIGTGVFLFFVHFLNVNLPAGWLRPLLGAAGT
jgi:putative tricarboxylic transport membrane protein